uniref:Uncharacterized protein n=1 Tax=Manihot esculenta TaxID=3983 RepID=A0A2C9WGU6_MANES
MLMVCHVCLISLLAVIKVTKDSVVTENCLSFQELSLSLMLLPIIFVFSLSTIRRNIAANA